MARRGSVTAQDVSEGLGRLGFAAALDWERPFLGPLLVVSYPRETRPNEDTRHAAEETGYRGRIRESRAWISDFLEVSPGCQGPWFSLKVGKGSAPWALRKGIRRKFSLR